MSLRSKCFNNIVGAHDTKGIYQTAMKDMRFYAYFDTRTIDSSTSSTQLKRLLQQSKVNEEISLIAHPKKTHNTHGTFSSWYRVFKIAVKAGNLPLMQMAYEKGEMTLTQVPVKKLLLKCCRRGHSDAVKWLLSTYSNGDLANGSSSSPASSSSPPSNGPIAATAPQSVSPHSAHPPTPPKTLPATLLLHCLYVGFKTCRIDILRALKQYYIKHHGGVRFIHKSGGRVFALQVASSDEEAVNSALIPIPTSDYVILFRFLDKCCNNSINWHETLNWIWENLQFDHAIFLEDRLPAAVLQHDLDTLSWAFGNYKLLHQTDSSTIPSAALLLACQNRDLKMADWISPGVTTSLKHLQSDLEDLKNHPILSDVAADTIALTWLKSCCSPYTNPAIP